MTIDAQMTTPFSTGDVNLICTDCGAAFSRSAAETAYYAERTAQPPTACPSCRAIQRAARNDAMRSGHADAGRDAGGGPAGAHRRGSAPGRGEPELFHAVCAACGKATEVPFRPRRGRPVFCRDCYNARVRDGNGSIVR